MNAELLIFMHNEREETVLRSEEPMLARKLKEKPSQTDSMPTRREVLQNTAQPE